MNPRYPTVAYRADNRCEYCHAPGAIFNLALEVEHILPISRGGTDTLDNLALACRACNLHKADHHTGLDPATKRVVPLFHPRKQRWNRHFQCDPVTGEILGKTQAGRATVARLQLNSPLQLAARQQWISIGLFP